MNQLDSDEILRIDHEHIWHPYASMTRPTPTYPVAHADGVYLELTDGRRLVDGMASWWCVIHGYNHPVLNQAIQDQLQNMAHVMFGGLTHEPAARLAQTLVEITPDGLDSVFFCDSGSVSVEVAIKMALQYWQSRNQPQKHRLLSLRDGYHGDTFGAMSVCDPVTGMHHLFRDAMPQQLFTESPRCAFHAEWDEVYLADFKQTIAQHAGELAAVILEPIVQGAGGMRFYHPEFLRRVRALCDAHNVLLIADEIATGFGRSGRLFACEWAGISPDILCLGKSLTGGYLTLAATLCSRRIRDGICEGEAGVFMHGPTFMANPLACAVANASVRLLLDSDWQGRVQSIETQLKTSLAPCAKLPSVAEVRVLGAIGVVEMKQAVDLTRVQQRFVEAGVWIRPFGKLVYLMPPYIIQPAELDRLCAAILELARNT